MWEIMSRIMNLKSGTPLQAPEMTTAEIHALTGVEDGMIVYNTDTRQLLTHVAGSWLAISNSGSAGTVTNVDTGVGLIGGPITGAGTIELAETGVEAGNYTSANITVDSTGRITAAESGDIGTVDSVVGTEGQIVVNSDDPANPVVSLADTAVTAGEYIAANITVDAQGRITAASSLTPSSTTQYTIPTWGGTDGKTLINNPNVKIDEAGNFIIGGSLGSSQHTVIGDVTVGQTGVMRILSSLGGALEINVDPNLTSVSTIVFSGSLNFPSDSGNPGQILTTDGSGNLSWQSTVASVNSVASTITVDSSDPMNINIDLPSTGITAGVYSSPSSITFDDYGRATAVTSGASTARGMIVLTSGSGTLASLLPAGVTSGKVTVIGGGGNGGSTTATTQIGSGGGAGGTAIAYVTDLTSSTQYVVGGAGQASTLTTDSVLMRGNPGSNGAAATTTTIVAGGAGGTATGGTINIPGQSGANVSTASTVGSGVGGNSFFNGGGRAVITTGAAGAGVAANLNTGCGGSGGFKSTTGTGGAGAAGIIIIEY